ncbi:hypothetical protein Ctob_010494 [Chrysochromulina tobinii]|uniref:Peptidoglycan binding-like domain-containing protein n=1 Tax=Chrysochromulina tobinii TaxID=1460289 RepID=A0A0M0JSC3_9EUKA|nr:hypothetical protein Ctob_010494 [Chrysochromulina tobinii]|eukprot:KOO29103.1 hypothetical protein Ctob_010494 [Chrysochromulina sp. CCMP291]
MSRDLEEPTQLDLEEQLPESPSLIDEATRRLEERMLVGYYRGYKNDPFAAKPEAKPELAPPASAATVSSTTPTPTRETAPAAVDEDWEPAAIDDKLTEEASEKLPRSFRVDDEPTEEASEKLPSGAGPVEAPVVAKTGAKPKSAGWQTLRELRWLSLHGKSIYQSTDAPIAKAAEMASAEMAEAEPTAVPKFAIADPHFNEGFHPNVRCDCSGMNPIVGMRYHLRGQDYDLCQAEYDKLSAAVQAVYEAIPPPALVLQPRRACYVLSAANMMLKRTPPWAEQAIELYMQAKALPLTTKQAAMADTKLALALSYLGDQDVKMLQLFLNEALGQQLVTPDGVYGPRTRQAVLDFESRFGMPLGADLTEQLRTVRSLLSAPKGAVAGGQAAGGSALVSAQEGAGQAIPYVLGGIGLPRTKHRTCSLDFNVLDLLQYAQYGAIQREDVWQREDVHSRWTRMCAGFTWA